MNAMKRLSWVLLVAAVTVGGITFFLGTRESPDRGGRVVPVVEDAPGTDGPDDERAAPPPAASTLQVIVPGSERGNVPVALADKDGIRAVIRVPINEQVPLYEIEADVPFVLAAIDDLSGAEILDHLHSRYRWPRPVLVKPGEWPQDIVIRFESAPLVRRIHVRAETTAGKPVSGALFEVATVHSATAAALPVAFVSTDDTGLAASPWLSAGPYQVRFRKAPRAQRPAEGKPLRVDLEAEREATLTVLFHDSGRVTGAVQGERGRKYPVDIVEATDSPTPVVRALHTEADGTFEASSLPPGDYVAVSWPLGYMETRVEFSVLPGETTHIVLVPAKGGTRVTGRFVDQEGEPLTRCAVNINVPLRPGLRPSGRPFGLTSDGRLEADGVAPGPKLAILWDHGYLRRFSVDPGMKRIDLGTFRMPRLEGGIAVHGDVLDDRGAALRGSLVCLRRVGATSEWIRFMRTDGNGRFRFKGVVPGRYLVWHEAVAYTNFVIRERPVEVTVAGEEETRVTLRLRRP